MRARFPLAVLAPAGADDAVGGTTGSAAAAGARPCGAAGGGDAERLVTAAGALLVVGLMLLFAAEVEDEGVSSGAGVGIDWLARRAPAAGGSGSMAGRWAGIVAGSVAPVASSVTGSGEGASRWARAARSICAAASLSPPLRSRSERASSSELLATSGQDTVDEGLEMPASK